MRILNIVNGNSVAGTLASSEIQGDILVWQESLYDGPIRLTDEISFQKERRSYWQDQGFANSPPLTIKKRPSNQLLHFMHFEEAVPVFKDYSSIILWFEHDLYDQLMLVYLLRFFYPYNLPLSLITLNSFPGIEFKGLGQLNAKQLTSLRESGVSIRKNHYLEAIQAWEAYAFPDPALVQECAKEKHSALPYLPNALKTHLLRFPSTFNGLNQLEQILLEAVNKRSTPSTVAQVIGEILTHPLNTMYGASDLHILAHLQALTEHPAPALLLDPPLQPSQASREEYFALNLTLTEQGKAYLEGQADFVVQHGLNRWLGGAQLVGNGPVWRFDQLQNSLIYP